ncbi:MAG TPA: 16S rRNA (uracil(1498)-N(3))-methyltransferase [Actinomycetales bacterium]|nr:16S rRNA (uracil(1498)-N(3))-methyltransferase [Actinomycetales bacterium]
MTAPLFLLEPGDLSEVAPGDTLLLDGSEGRHAATVRRIGVGEKVDVGDGAGAVARCEVREVVGAERREGLRLLVLAVDEVPVPDLRFVLVQALAKGGRDDLAIETATELGVDEVVPWQAARSVVVWRGPRGEKAQASWVSTVRAAAKQSRRPRVPVVAPVETSRELADRVSAAALAVVLHEDAPTPLGSLALPDVGDVVLVVGPEGGISPDELRQLSDAGAVSARLGPHVLRSSTAGPAALAVLSAAARWG